MPRIQLALARGAAGAATRRVDAGDARTWAFCGFSQNEEDGILDVLISFLKAPTRYFLEIGSGQGLENNTAWLAICKRWSGLMIDGDPDNCAIGRALYPTLALGVEFHQAFVTVESVPGILAKSKRLDPDVFSLDVDGMDLHLMKALFAAGLRPRIAVVEYNSTFGPDLAVTVPYRPDFKVSEAHPSRLYYGASIRGWRALFEPAGYRFVTVDGNGVDAFFVDPEAVRPGVLEGLSGLEFTENFFQARCFGPGWNAQLTRLNGLPLARVDH